MSGVPSSAAPYTQRAHRTRLVTIGEDLSVSVDAAPSGYFSCLLHAAAEAATAGAPREREPSRLSWQRGPDLRVGSRITIWSGEEWELLDNPAPQRSGLTTLGYAAPVLPVDVLYPRRATLANLAGETITEDVPLAIWQPTESDRERGAYAGNLGEVPIDYTGVLEPNRRLLVGDLSMVIAQATADYETPRIEMELSRG